MDIKLMRLTKKYAVMKLNPQAPIPIWLQGEMFVSITRTDEELSLVLDEELIGDHIEELQGGEVFKGFVGLKVKGPLDFNLIGILAEISGTLSNAGISIFAVSTFDTDYIFFDHTKIDQAVQALESKGMTVI